ALFVVEAVHGLSPFLAAMGYVIWGMFALQFFVELAVAPRKSRYLRNNWLTAVALAVPALRMLRVLRVVRLGRMAGTARALRGARMVRIVSSLNRGMRALRAGMRRRGLSYVLLLTLIVVTAGAAGMYAFEGNAAFDSYGAALWWTAMLITTIGSDYWPLTPGGRLLCLLLSVYGLAVFGYVTAALASFFIGRDIQDASGAVAHGPTLADLHGEISRLREQLKDAGIAR